MRKFNCKILIRGLLAVTVTANFFVLLKQISTGNSVGATFSLGFILFGSVYLIKTHKS